MVSNTAIYLLRIRPRPKPKVDRRQQTIGQTNFNGRGKKQQKHSQWRQEAEHNAHALQSTRRKNLGIVMIMKDFSLSVSALSRALNSFPYIVSRV